MHLEATSQLDYLALKALIIVYALENYETLYLILQSKYRFYSRDSTYRIESSHAKSRGQQLFTKFHNTIYTNLKPLHVRSQIL